MSVTLAVRTATAALVAPLRRSIHCPSLSLLFGKVVLMTHFIAAIALLALAKSMTCRHLPALFGMDRSLFFLCLSVLSLIWRFVHFGGRRFW
ncbi:hypothetical protein C366_06751 [Cryptococcus neoformans Tu401-1]|nr:hypothetical protein C365_06803 [Cryptococcus neoformans var. grubii Bt85]OXG10507.1 hypothetical protein C366_06751 [Cryptococcus neoformans var. grubii Tu401-1]OXM75700.1 hypothetical protein C364_06727 [Cryptococcus neoformans var. grubii Bt63]